MSDDLIKRLRETDSYNKKYYALDPLHNEAADRIEELKLCRIADAITLIGEQRKLAKAVEALRKLDRRNDSLDTFDNAVHEIVSTVLAELEGGA